MQDLQYRLTEQEDPDNYAVIQFGMESAGMEAASTVSRHPVNVYGYERDSLVAGLIGYTVGAAFVIRSLWVESSFRSNGVARRMLSKAENEAQGRGAKICFIDMMSYQSPDFFVKIGYEEVTRVPGFHDEHDRIFLKKNLG